MIKIFYDCETTGTNYKLNSVIQISGIVEKYGMIVEKFIFNIRPHEKAQIELEALKVCNKTVEEIMAYPSIPEAHDNIINMLNKYIDRYDRKQKAWLVGFNNRAFDDNFFRKFFELNKNSFFGSYFWSDSLDVLVLASQYLLERRKGMPSFKLKRVATELGIVVNEDRLHDALYDAEITRKIYRIVTGLDLEI